MDVRNFAAYLFLRPFRFYLYITTKYDMSFPFEQGRGTRKWSTFALGLERNRGPRYITLHDYIFARNSGRIHHGRCRNTACRFTTKASCGYNVPMSVGTWIFRIRKSELCEDDTRIMTRVENHALFTRTVADRPGIRTVSQPLHNVLFTVGSLMGYRLSDQRTGQ